MDDPGALEEAAAAVRRVAAALPGAVPPADAGVWSGPAADARTAGQAAAAARVDDLAGRLAAEAVALARRADAARAAEAAEVAAGPFAGALGRGL